MSPTRRVTSKTRVFTSPCGTESVGKQSVCAPARRSASDGALLSRLSEGIQWTALSVNTHRPLFWFLGGKSVTFMADLRGRRLAVHAPHTAPGCFARIVLRGHGLDPDRDLDCVVRAPGDYQMDLRKLADNSIDAAYVGSTLAPEQIADEQGFHVLAWVGDHFEIPTVGVAVDPARLQIDSPAVQAVVRANQRALRTIADRPDLAVLHGVPGNRSENTAVGCRPAVEGAPVTPVDAILAFR